MENDKEMIKNVLGKNPTEKDKAMDELIKMTYKESIPETTPLDEIVSHLIAISRKLDEMITLMKSKSK